MSVSTSNRAPSRCAICSRVHDRSRAPASSSARGIPSSRRHTSAAIAARAGSSKAAAAGGDAATARRRKRARASLSGPSKGSGRTSTSCSPGLPSGSREVVSTVRSGADCRSSPTRCRQAAIRCSQVSRTRRSFLSAIQAHSSSSSDRAEWSARPTVCATVAVSRSGSRNGEFDPPDPVGSFGPARGGGPPGEPGLADSAHPGQGDQSPARQQLLQMGEFTLPSDEARRLRRQVSRHRARVRPGAAACGNWLTVVERVRTEHGCIVRDPVCRQGRSGQIAASSPCEAQGRGPSAGEDHTGLRGEGPPVPVGQSCPQFHGPHGAGRLGHRDPVLHPSGAGRDRRAGPELDDGDGPVVDVELVLVGASTGVRCGPGQVDQPGEAVAVSAPGAVSGPCPGSGGVVSSTVGPSGRCCRRRPGRGR